MVTWETFECNNEWARRVYSFHSDGVFYRAIEELRMTLLLPQEECRSYTLLEFKKAQTTMNQERRHILERLSHCRGVILNKVPHLSSAATSLNVRAAATLQKDHRSLFKEKEMMPF